MPEASSRYERLTSLARGEDRRERSDGDGGTSRKERTYVRSRDR